MIPLLLLQVSPDNTRIPPATQIIDTAGAVWTLSGLNVMRDGAFTNGQGTILAWCNAGIWTFGTDQHWWAWINNTWVQSGTTDPCPGTPPPETLTVAPDVIPVVQTLMNASDGPWGTFTLTGYTLAVLPVDLAGNPPTGPPTGTLTMGTVPTDTIEIDGQTHFRIPMTADIARSLTQAGPVGQWYRAGVAWRGYSTAAGTTIQDPSVSGYAYSDRWFVFDLPTNQFTIYGEVVKGKGRPPVVQAVTK